MYLFKFILCLVLGECTSQPCVLNQTKNPYIKITRSGISYEMPELILPLQSYYVLIVLIHYNAMIYIITDCLRECSGFAALAVGPSLVSCGRCIVDEAGEFRTVDLELHTVFMPVFSNT